MSDSSLVPILNMFPGLTIGVIGDIMLDCFIWGEVERISPEAPIPIVLIERESSMPGGAANTAHNIVSLGGRVALLGVLGQDDAGDQVQQSLKKIGIDNNHVFQISNRKTTKKTRIVGKGQQLLRLDSETTAVIDSQIEDLIIACVQREITHWSALIISDYIKGVVTETLAKKIIDLSRTHNVPIIVDTKSKKISHFAGCSLIAPNHHEAHLITGEKEIRRAGIIIQQQLDCSVLITQGSDGMTLFTKDETCHLPTQAREIFDVAGAGDTVVAAMALSLASGASLVSSAKLANHAAAISVGKFGTAVVRPEELIADATNDG